ncbi:MAG TPA: hypothetical protein VEU77_00425 [Candidatus Acidoferrales bacterium]|nr:hypothetical protein [Candidatus Acidoferrales bacterium]
MVPTPTPTGAPSASQVATPTLNPSFVVSPTPGARIARSDAALQTSAALVLFEFPGDDRLRGVAWDASASGVLGPRVAFPWFPSPDGMRYAAGGKVYDRDGREIASLPWQDASFTWSSDGQLLCKALPEVVRTGSQMRVETLVPGQAPRTIASGFATYSDNAGYPVIACDPRSDRVVVVAAGQGLFAGHMWTFELSSGRLVRSATLGQGAIGSWLVATSDGAMLAHTVQATMDGTATTVVQRTDDGTALATLSDFQARGFSGDGSMLYGWASGNRVEIREWKTGRLVWSSTGYPPPYAVSVAAPGGARFAIAFGRDNTLKDTDLYLVSSDGTSRVLEHVTVIFP